MPIPSDQLPIGEGADKNDKRQRLIREHVAALAVMHLTRRKDLNVVEPDDDFGFDLRVRILSPERGHRSSALRSAAFGRRLPASRRTPRHRGPSDGAVWTVLPSLSFLFTMEETQGW